MRRFLQATFRRKPLKGRAAERVDAGRSRVDSSAWTCSTRYPAQFDFIVSNPPYVRQGDLSRLQREVREHEPHVALFSPEDELSIYRRLISGAESRLKGGGCLVMEIGIGMEDRVTALFGEGWETFPTRADLQGIPRTVVARKSA